MFSREKPRRPRPTGSLTQHITSRQKWKQPFGIFINNYQQWIRKYSVFSFLKKTKMPIRWKTESVQRQLSFLMKMAKGLCSASLYVTCGWAGGWLVVFRTLVTSIGNQVRVCNVQ